MSYALHRLLPHTIYWSGTMLQVVRHTVPKIDGTLRAYAYDEGMESSFLNKLLFLWLAAIISNRRSCLNIVFAVVYIYYVAVRHRSWDTLILNETMVVRFCRPVLAALLHTLLCVVNDAIQLNSYIESLSSPISGSWQRSYNETNSVRQNRLWEQLHKNRKKGGFDKCEVW